LGKGRPGWHIECSAMSDRFLGVPFDIHEGGVDNIFSHHENEIAQTKGATGNIPARYWLHCRHLLVRGRKMSKSLGNYYSVEDVHRMGYGYDAIRALLLRTHYRRRLDFTFKRLNDIASDLRRCKRCLAALCRWGPGIENAEADAHADRALSSFMAHVSDDFDFPSAMEDFCHYVRKVERLMAKKRFGKGNAEKARRAILSMDAVLGFIGKKASHSQQI
jgi:cysteinyl-tRNA synthetase